MAFGIPNSSDLNGLADKLGSIVASVGPEVSAVLSTVIQQINEHANALEDKEIAAVVTAEDKMLQRVDTLISTLQKFESFVKFAEGFDISIVPKGTSTV